MYFINMQIADHMNELVFGEKSAQDIKSIVLCTCMYNNSAN